ncbi:MAG: NYN domain-containing protein [bacterium]
MIKHYVIDGNNLIGKMSQSGKRNTSSREQLVLKLDRYFHQKKVNVSLHFDGFEKETISATKIRIFYSQKRTADALIKNEIENHNSSKSICVVTSDFNLMEFARVCSCKVKKSEEFANELKDNIDRDNEEEKIKSISNEEMRKLFLDNS